MKLLYALRTKRHPPKSGDIAAMRSFLTSLGLERYCKTFEDEGVDMGAVDVMDESDYAELGVAKVRGVAPCLLLRLKGGTHRILGAGGGT